MQGLQPGSPLGASYTLVEIIGQGASGQVWKLEHAKKTEALVAKILHSYLVDDSAIVERFIRERSVLLGLNHEHIVPVRDLVVEGSTLALVMDYCQGGSLRDLLVERQTFEPSIALKIVATVLEALGYAHGQDVIHRDIKPDNILFASSSATSHIEDEVRVADFGISSILSSQGSSTTGIVGTPHYISPELVQTGVAGTAGDVYSAGIMLYELLAGRTPFAGEGTDFTIAYRHVNSQVPPLDIPEPLWNIVLSLLNKNPQQRPHPLDAAAQLHRLAERYQGLPALAPVLEPGQFIESERPQTIVRGAIPEPQKSSIHKTAEISPAPFLGESSEATIIKPQHVNRAVERPELDSVVDTATDSGIQRRKMWFLGAIGLLLLAVAGWGIYWAVSSGSSKSPFSADGKQEPVLPSGLSVQRTASYDPKSSTISLSTTYSAQKAQLSGDFLEVFPGVNGGDCPNVVGDEGLNVQRNQPMVTGVDASCSWAYKGVIIEPNESVTVKSKVSLKIGDQKQLDAWLSDVSKKTQEAISSKEYKSTSYPVQRIQSISVKVPDHAVSQSVLPVSLLPVWPSGEDALNPLYSSENIGAPSGMVQALAGDKSPVKFSDGCGGHLMVDSSGLKVTALSAVEQCTLNGQVGNFTDLKSNQFSITTRK